MSVFGGDGRAEFLIYSRLPPDSLVMTYVPQRFPELTGRIHTFSVVQYGPPHWKDPATSAEFKLRVKELLHLK